MTAIEITADQLRHGDIEAVDDGWGQRRLANPRPVNDSDGSPAYIMVDMPDRIPAIYPADQQVTVFRS